MKKASLYYSSKFGQTRKIADRIAAEMRQREWDVREVNLAEDRDAGMRSGDDLVIMGAPLYARNYPRPFRRFVQQHLGELKRSRVAFFSVSLTASPGTKESLWESIQPVRSLFEELDWTPEWLASFAGALKYIEYSPLVRRVMKRITRQAGGPTDTTQDYEFTDWEQVTRFVEEVSGDRKDGEFSMAHVPLATRRLDGIMPDFDLRMVDEIRISAPPSSVRKAFESLGPSDMPMAEFLARIRTLGQKKEVGEATPRSFLEGAEKFGVTPMHQDDNELIGGLIGKFWERRFGIHRAETADEFSSFANPQYTKVLSNFWMGELPGGKGTLLRSETRMRSLGPDSRRRFAWYWRILGPGIRLYMRSMLNGVRRSVQRDENAQGKGKSAA